MDFFSHMKMFLYKFTFRIDFRSLTTGACSRQKKMSIVQFYVLGSYLFLAGASPCGLTFITMHICGNVHCSSRYLSSVQHDENRSFLECSFKNECNERPHRYIHSAHNHCCCNRILRPFTPEKENQRHRRARPYLNNFFYIYMYTYSYMYVHH